MLSNQGKCMLGPPATIQVSIASSWPKTSVPDTSGAHVGSTGVCKRMLVYVAGGFAHTSGMKRL